jgi:ADP-ribose pyrophosphatase YjhB (NUDIX family)
VNLIIGGFMNNTFLKEPWLKWAIEIQSIAQCGLTYTKDVYDKERYEQLRNIAAEMLSYKTEIPVNKIKNLFCNEEGYQTPKLDTRAAIFKDGKILLVHEKSGTWSLPGGWVDVLESIESNTIKEVKEEAGLDVIAKKIIAIQDRNKHNTPLYPYGLCKVFVQCDLIGGEFIENIETTEIGYFSLDNLPNLSNEKSNFEQIEMCFKAKEDENWIVVFD